MGLLRAALYHPGYARYHTPHRIPHPVIIFPKSKMFYVITGVCYLVSFTVVKNTRVVLWRREDDAIVHTRRLGGQHRHTRSTEYAGVQKRAVSQRRPGQLCANISTTATPAEHRNSRRFFNNAQPSSRCLLVCCLIPFLSRILSCLLCTVI